MPRTARKMSSSGIYHIMLRGINRQMIFSDDEDCDRFIMALKEYKAVSGFNLYGFCLMGNHVHLLIRPGKESLELIFKRIGSKYVYWYNWKYKRCGHLFQDRYLSEAVENDQYFSAVLRYIHQNPVKAGMCISIEDYKWSSYNDYRTKSGITDVEFALGIIGESKLEWFMKAENEDKCLEHDDKLKRLTDEEVAVKIEEKFKIKAPLIQNEPKEVMKDILRSILELEGISTRQISRVTGISTNVIWKL